MLRLIYTSTKIITGISSWSHLAWIASHNAFALIGNGSKKLYHDGTCISIGFMFSTATFQSTPGSQAIGSALNGWFYPVDEITFQPNLNTPYFRWTRPSGNRLLLRLSREYPVETGGLHHQVLPNF